MDVDLTFRATYPTVAGRQLCLVVMEPVEAGELPVSTAASPLDVLAVKSNCCVGFCLASKVGRLRSKLTPNKRQRLWLAHVACSPTTSIKALCSAIDLYNSRRKECTVASPEVAASRTAATHDACTNVFMLKPKVRNKQLGIDKLTIFARDTILPAASASFEDQLGKCELDVDSCQRSRAVHIAAAHQARQVHARFRVLSTHTL